MKQSIQYKIIMSDNLMENLNIEQLEAVLHKDGPLLIVAGAGTGKTTVITQKIAYMIEQGWAKSDEILALTFTEKTAGEMEERVDRLLPIGYLDLWISTFHGFAERILKAHGLDIGLSSDFKLLNEFEQWALIKKNLDKFNLDYYQPAGNPTKFIDALLRHFSRLKDEDIAPTDYLKYAEELKEDLDGMLSKVRKGKSQKSKVKNSEIAEQEATRINEVANAYHVYQQLLLDEGVMDFGDLINYTLKLFRERPGILQKYRQQFKYVLVDEFQDTNWAQYELVKMLTNSKNNLIVVGDDDQCLPGDSMILTKNGKRRIDQIKTGEEVATAVGKGYLSYNKVIHVNKNNKQTKLLTFKTKNGHKITATDNHKMFCFVPPSQWHYSVGRKEDKKFYYVYLMHKQELGWRLGITNDLAVRLKLERSADRIVAIRVFSSEAEARYNETWLSLKYGIPTACFQERGGVMDKKEWSEKLYKDLDVESNVKKLAEDLNIDLKAHQVCLDAVNRGGKVRIKIILEMCSRNYRSKYAKGIFLQSPQVIHQLSVETTHQSTIKILENSGFILNKAKKGKRLRITSADFDYLGKLARKIEKATGGIIENRIKVGKINIAHKKSSVVPASNVLSGMFLPVVTGKGIIYDQVLERKEENKKITVYDLEINRTHNFVANGIIVHNSIYRFRGASMSNILQFKKDYPKAKQIIIAKNYRNRQNILDLSYEFIKLNNPNRLEWQFSQKSVKSVKSKVCKELSSLSKKLAAQVEGKGIIEVIKGEDLRDEVAAVINKIADLKIQDKKLNWGDFAILVRANDSAKEFTNALDIAGLPYQFLASRGLYTKPVIMDIVSYLNLLDNYHESKAMYRVLNLPIFEFSYKELVNFNYWAHKKSWSLFEVLRSASMFNLGAELQKKINKVLGLVEKHTALVRHKNVSEIILAFLNESRYLKYLISQEEARSREVAGYLNQFMKRVKTFEAGSDDKTVKGFLEELNMEINSGEEGALAPDMELGPDTIKIMTVHAAKGLEFEHIFIANMVDKRFPTIERKEQILIPDALIKEALPEGDIHMEEERRLFYVAMTRAKQGLYFSWAPDYGGARKKKPSKFLAECKLVKEDAVGNKRALSPEDQFKSKEKISDSAFKDIEYKAPNYFSYSQLAAFSNCPYQYRFAHILKIPMRGKAVFSFGKTMHSVLQKLFVLIGEKKGLGQADLFNKITKQENKKTETIEFKEILELYEQSWIDDWYESKRQKEEYREKGKEILKGFYEKYKNNWPNAILTEKGFNIKLTSNGDLYTVRGVIDRIDKEEGKVKIVDYKTGKPKEKLTFEEKEQLLIYQIAIEDLFREEVGSLSFYYLDNNSEAEFVGSREDIAKVKEKIIGTIEDIKKGVFQPKPSQLCKFCDFFEICEFRKS